jgi:polysaccharide deacetylase 2 family uncharacterized protein YibQ
MTKKKRKGRKKKRSTPYSLYAFLAVGLIGFVILCLYLLFPKPAVRKVPPVYEEIYSTSSDLQADIRRIDEALYASLYRSGAKKERISFLDVQPRHEGGKVWDFSRLMVECRDRPEALRLRKAMGQYLKTLGPEIQFLGTEESQGRLLCRVTTEGLWTHEVILRFDSREEATEDTRPKIALIVDDLGYDAGLALAFMKVDLPMSCSVLPAATFTRRIVREASKKKRELILHLPMQPKNYPAVDPGPGALLLSMDEAEIRKTLDQDLRDIPGAQGVNNHMGSSFTENREKMLIVLRELKRRNLFYVDSRTTRGTVGFELAKTLDLPVGKRSVFLDNDLAPRAISIQMERLMSMAKQRGAAIGIGHPHRETLEVLNQYVSKLNREFHMVPVAELVR